MGGVGEETVQYTKSGEVGVWGVFVQIETGRQVVLREGRPVRRELLEHHVGVSIKQRSGRQGLTCVPFSNDW